MDNRFAPAVRGLTLLRGRSEFFDMLEAWSFEIFCGDIFCIDDFSYWKIFYLGCKKTIDGHLDVSTWLLHGRVKRVDFLMHLG